MARGQALRLSRAHLRKNGMQGNGDEMDAGADAARAQLVDEFIAADVELVQVQANGVEMPGMAAVFARGRRLHFLQSGQAALVYAGVSRAQGMQALDFFELAQADGGLHIAEVVLETGLEHLVIPVPFFGVAVPGVLGDAVQTQHAHALGQGGVVGGDHAALAGGDVLGGVEAEGRRGAGRAGSSRREAAILSVGGVSGVFNDVQTMALRNLPDFVHAAGQPAQMDGDDGSRAGGHPRGDTGGIEIAVRADIGQHRRRAHLQDDIDGGAERERSSNDFITLADTGCGQGQVQAGGAGVHGQCMARAGVRPEAGFETGGAIAGGQPAGAQGIRHLGDFFLADGRHMKRYEGSLFHDFGMGVLVRIKNFPPVSSVSPVPDRSRRARNCSGRSTAAA